MNVTTYCQRRNFRRIDLQVPVYVSDRVMLYVA